MRKRHVPDLKRLGVLFEGNYRRMRQLTAVLEDAQPRYIYLHAAGHYLGQIRLQLVESCKYTDTILLEQIHNSGRWLNNPKMTVRVYHDAGVAEVISCCRYQRIEAVNDYPNRFMHHPDEKTQINAFLAEWLTFCLKFGLAAIDFSHLQTKCD